MQESDLLIPEESPVDNNEESKEPVVEHTGVECDGCGTAPIMNIRYKCAVCKDFDYCEKCEASLGHDHPFLKIRKAGGAPSMIITVLNEDAEGNPGHSDEKPDWKQMKEAWKTAKQEWRQEKGKNNNKPCNDWTEEDCNDKAKFFKNMVGGFLNKMGLDKSEWKNCEDWKNKDWSHCKKDWKKNCNWQGKGDYKLKRAVIVNNPETVYECQPGCVVLHDIEIKNNTCWGWK